jgi:hypothetical protein
MRDALTVVGPAVAKLGALRAPDDVRPRFEAILGSLRRRLALLQDAEGKLRDHGEPISIFAALRPKLGTLARDEADGWRDIGLPACVTP